MDSYCSDAPLNKLYSVSSWTTPSQLMALYFNSHRGNLSSNPCSLSLTLQPSGYSSITYLLSFGKLQISLALSLRWMISLSPCVGPNMLTSVLRLSCPSCSVMASGSAMIYTKFLWLLCMKGIGPFVTPAG